MNILFLDQFSDPGGAQLCLKDLMPEILRRGWNPRLMVPGGGDLVEWSNRLGIPTCTLPLRPYSNGSKTALDFLRFSVDGPRMAAAVRRVVREERVDMVYVNGPRVLPAVLGAGCPVVFHTHSYVRVRYGRKLLEWTLRAADATVIAASQYVADGYTQKVRVVYNGTGDLQRGTRSFHRRRIRVGIIGRIAPEKGQLDFMRAARRITENGGDAEFLVYGSRLYADAGYEAQVRAMAGGSPVIFCGWTDDVARALHDLEILAVPSGPDEAATRVIMEAFSAGTPVVAYRAGGIPELVEDGRTGVLTETSDFESLARGIQALMDDRELMKRLSAAGRKEWLRRFRVERFRTTVCDLLETCATSTPRE
jgi:glycosyltransferase involved in cell wall biosynthesis